VILAIWDSDRAEHEVEIISTAKHMRSMKERMLNEPRLTDHSLQLVGFLYSDGGGVSRSFRASGRRDGEASCILRRLCEYL